jgi:hypothetical protein
MATPQISSWHQNDTLITLKAYGLALIADSYRAKESSATRTLDIEDSIMLLVTAAQMQKFDQRTIKEFSIPGLILMENAGRGIFELICRHFAARLYQGVTILVGPGCVLWDIL